ncbi:DUF692 family protein [Sneathiella sp. P13V-1]|uniref:MNIO family bufferin maturase n=1 Tax=Sneathiella sp. P13V-1 TaxID=2697366 RepID=UPI00187B9632|nr:DUF692 domain-containing protein [Sneathiella sp. P13V-1]MBE7635676.1 DUF692 family protein [Sneathiella sp. P13V-1]
MYGKPIDIGDLTLNPTIRSGLPFGVGVGLKREHLPGLRDNPNQIQFVEVHAENFMDGGPQLELLKDISKIWPVSIHGVALSLGGEDPLDKDHLRRLKHLIDTIQPGSFSEHIAWSSHNGVYYNDLFPIPYNRRRLYHLADRIDRVQQILGTRMLVENPSSYVRFQSDTMFEADFIAELVDETSCGLLLDVNNLYVSAQNHGWDTKDWLSRIPVEAVGEIHLAGHEASEDDNGNSYLVDTHGSEVVEPVWTLYCELLSKIGPCPTLIERDNNVPPLGDLLNEVSAAQLLIDAAKERFQ